MNRGLITFLTFFTAAINGAGAGILWTAQGKYVSECACDANQGFYMGYFWAFFMSSQIIGNVVAWGVLKSGTNQSTLFVVFAIMAVVGSFTFCFLGKPKQVDDDEEEEGLELKEPNPI